MSIKCYGDFLKEYFPERYKKWLEEMITPEERAKRDFEKILEDNMYIKNLEKYSKKTEE